MTKNLDRAKELRGNQTDAEKFVWRQLRNRRFEGFKFRRQVPLGNYIVDFVCFDHRLIVELDGGQHNESSHRTYDANRDGWLRLQGFNVVRFWNHEVFTEWEVIEEVIWRELHKAPSPPAPLPQGARGEGGVTS
jgi:very-short-patch-repair endonuclease